MRTLRNPWFIMFCVLWFALFAARKTGVHIPELLNGYLGDLLAVPVVATLGLCYQRVAHKNARLILNRAQIVFIIVYISVVFELILPHFFPRFTADILDVLCYAAGGFFFATVMNRPFRESASNRRHP
ncbi:MAG: hypothetical protein INR69_00975 [Mucilaginibacter polytrichastri]|nr:hypothetical protein [Mucilaginibacter polytrichastri]